MCWLYHWCYFLSPLSLVFAHTLHTSCETALVWAAFFSLLILLSASKRCAPTSLCSPPSSRRFPPGTWTELFYGPCSLSEGTQTVSSQTVLGNEPVLRKQKLLRGVLACSCQSVVCWLLFTMAASLPACYHGVMTKKECEDLLGKKNKDGAYLIRDSETIQGAMCLCV